MTSTPPHGNTKQVVSNEQADDTDRVDNTKQADNTDRVDNTGQADDTCRVDSTDQVDDIKQAIIEKGFWTVEDAAIGAHVDRLLAGYKFKSVDGLDLITASLRPPVRQVLESFFPISTLSFYKSWGRTKRDHRILGTTVDLQILIVCAWSSNSEFKLYSQSHHLDVPTEKAPNGNEQTVDPSYDIPGGTTTAMKNGGLAILDARSWWRGMSGQIITLGYVVSTAEQWPKIPLTSTLRDKVESMKGMDSGTIRLNFDFS